MTHNPLTRFHLWQGCDLETMVLVMISVQTEKCGLSLELLGLVFNVLVLVFVSATRWSLFFVFRWSYTLGVVNSECIG